MTTKYTKNFALALPDFRMGPWHDLVNGNTTKLDQIVFGALSRVDTPLWDNDTLYAVGTVVVDVDTAASWMCNVEHTSPATGTFEDYRTAYPTHWVQLLAGFAPRGEWANVTEYRPYDLVYESSTGIFAQCKARHTSNADGTLEDDEAYWYWIVNFSEAQLGEAITVAYVPTAPITGVNVQDALDQIAGMITSLNNVNITQGDSITALQNADTTHDSRLTAVESKNASQDTLITNLQTSLTALQNALTALDGATVKLAGNQTIGPGGYSATGKDLGNLGNFQVNPKLGNYQYGNNVGAITISAPAVDGGVDLMIFNQAGAGGVSFSGFTVNPTNTGDPITTVNGHKFLVSMRRIGGWSTYAVKAMQ